MNYNIILKFINLFGKIFIILSFFVFILIYFIGSASQSPIEKYDSAAILKNGVSTNAQITDISSMNNVSVNGEHPVLIHYSYAIHGKQIHDSFQTLELNKVNAYKQGDTIRIKYLNDQSVVENMKPFSFPFEIFYVIPGIFLIVGITFVLSVMFAKRLIKKCYFPEQLTPGEKQ